MVWLLKMSSQTNWQQLGATDYWGDIKTLYKDTSTNILYAGGMFSYFAGYSTKTVIQWNGVKWDTLGGGLDKDAPPFTFSLVKKILKYKGYIYFFGSFYQAGSLPCNNMARWNGTQWDTLAGSADAPILDADVFNDTLYACGSFTTIGGINSNLVAKFDGTNWHAMSFPYGNQGPMTHIRGYKDKIYGSGAWYTGGFGLTAKYSAQTGWQPAMGVQGDGTKTIEGIERIDTLLYFFGRFTHLSVVKSPGIAAWSGTKIYGCGLAVNPSPNYSFVRSIQKINNKIYCVGQFDNAGGLKNGTNFLSIASFTDSLHWCIYGDDFDNVVSDIETYNNDIIIGGAFKNINGNSNKIVTKWIGGNYTYSCNYKTKDSIDVIDNGEFQIYPNPTNSVITLTGGQFDLPNTTISITTNLGQVILSQPFSNQLDLSSLASGMYYITVQGGSNKKTVKVVKE